jgi:hypothetical protein
MSAHWLHLGIHLANLKDRFLPDERVRELKTPEFFERDFDARAFLVLVHSSFEQFFEDVAADFAHGVVDAWLRGTVPSKQLVISIAAFAVVAGDFSKTLELPETVEDSEASLDIEPRTRLTASLREGLPKFQNRLGKNHGADLHYLRNLFVPLGIYVNPPPDARSALTHIANARGTFAHRRTVLTQGRFAYQPISATDAVADTERLFHWCIGFEDELTQSLQPPYARIHEAARSELLAKLCGTLTWVAAIQAGKVAKA